MKQSSKDHEPKIIRCICVHGYQDSKYGSGHRVANYARNANNKQGGYRCTVCERVSN